MHGYKQLIQPGNSTRALAHLERSDGAHFKPDGAKAENSRGEPARAARQPPFGSSSQKRPQSPEGVAQAAGQLGSSGRMRPLLGAASAQPQAAKAVRDTEAVREK